MGSLGTELVYRRFGQRLRSTRIRRSVSQQKLADAIGLQRTSVTNIERGHQRVLLHTVAACARALHVSPAALLNGVL